MPSLKNIKKLLKKHKPELQKEFKIKKIGIFGSYIKNKPKKKSDLDILVEFKETPGLFKFIELENHLSKLLGVKVDLVMKSALKPVIGKYILKEVVFA